MKGTSREAKSERKRKRNIGEEYITKNGKKVNAKKLKELSACRMKCQFRFDEDIRRKVFLEFWNCGSYNKRVQYVAGLVSMDSPIHIRSKKDTPIDKIKYRNVTYKYTLTY